MQVCGKCGHKFKYLELYKSFFSGYKNLVCSKCGAVHKHNFTNRLFAALAVGVPLLPVLVVFKKIIASNTINIVIYVVLALLCTLLMPYIMKFKIEE
jgi:CXXC-20-CXXC protein